MIERQPVTNPSAAIVARQAETGEAERIHNFSHGRRHGALCIGRVIGVGVRYRGPAVAGQVGDHQREMLCEHRRHAMPHHVRLRMAVQQQERRSAASGAGKDLPADVSIQREA